MEKQLEFLLNSPNKSIEINKIFLINNIEIKESEDDLIQLNLKNDEIQLKGILMVKVEIYPIHKENNLLLIKKLILKLNEYFVLQLYVEGEIIFKTENNIINDAPKVISFKPEDITQTLSKLSKFDLEKTESSIFQIISINQKNLKIKLITDLKIYEIELTDMEDNSTKVNEFLYIQYYTKTEKKIIIHKFTFIEVLNEEKLFQLGLCIDCKDITVYKIIDIENDNYILIDLYEKLYKLNKNSKSIKDKEFDFCKFVLITKPKITVKDEFNFMELSDSSFIYLSSQYLHFSKKILLNTLSVFKFSFIDYNEKGNLFDKICSKYFSNEINKKEQYIVFIGNDKPKYQYYGIEITLSSTKNKSKDKKFYVYLFYGLINKINAFININEINTYFYEYFVYKIDSYLNDFEKKILVDKKEYCIKNFDYFGSTNRKRICVMNVPYQDMEIEEKEFIGKTNSIQECKLIKGSHSKVIGIYDISETTFNNNTSNSVFDEYYSFFGDIIGKIKSFDLYGNKDELQTFFLDKIEKMKKVNIEFDSEKIFEENMNLSQYKTRIGLLICKYISLNISNIVYLIFKIKTFLYDIENENLEYNQIIRLFSFYFIDNEKNSEQLKLVFINKLNKNSPYVKAFNYNLDEIEGITEFSRIFQGYLQLDSYVKYNYLHDENSYSFSMELLFMMKFILKSSYEPFFFIWNNDQTNIQAYFHKKNRLTVINEKLVFHDIEKDLKNINDIEKSMKYVMPISILFKHEKNSHHKYNLKNPELSPILYAKGLKMKIITKYQENKIKGESGQLIENYICEDKEVINELINNFCFEELLKTENFLGNSDSIIIETVKKYASNSKKQKKDNNNIIKNIRNSLEQNEKEFLENKKRFIIHGDLVFQEEDNYPAKNSPENLDKILVEKRKKINNFLNRLNKK